MINFSFIVGVLTSVFCNGWSLYSLAVQKLKKNFKKLYK